jgi:hypothetical protein
MAVRSRRLWGPTRVAAAGVSTPLFTVPLLRTAIIRTQVIYGATGLGNFYLLINGVGAATHGLLGPTPLAAGARLALVEDWILNPGDILYAHNTSGNSMVYTGFGSLLDGPPE